MIAPFSPRSISARKNIRGLCAGGDGGLQVCLLGIATCPPANRVELKSGRDRRKLGQWWLLATTRERRLVAEGIVCYDPPRLGRQPIVLGFPAGRMSSLGTLWLRAGSW